MKINIKHIRPRGYVLLWLCSLLSTLSIRAAERPADSQTFQKIDSDYVLILNAYGESAPWSRIIIDTVMADLSAMAPELTTLTENMNLLLVENEQDLIHLQHRIDSIYKRAPRFVIYTGTSGWALMHKTIEKKWGTLPTILFAAEDFVGPKKNYLQNSPVAPQQRTPLKQVAAQDSNMSIVYFPVYIRETIELMQRLIPDMKELLFLSDKRWISAQNRADVAAITKIYFPELKVRYLIAGDISTPDLLDSLQHCGMETGSLFFSWISQTGEGHISTLNTAAYKIIGKYAKQPLFILNDVEVSNDSDIIGGYFLPRQAISREIRSVLAEGLAGRSVGFRIPEDPSPVFDYLSLIRKGFDPELLPDDTYFYWKPESFFSQYRYHVLGLTLAGIILLLVIYLLLRSRQLQRRQITLMTDYRNLFDNMPIAYLQLEMLRDTAGNPDDLIVRDVNPSFEKTLIPHEKIVGKKHSQSRSLSENALNLCKNVIAEQQAISMPYYFKQTDTNYTAILAPAQKKNFIDVFFVDNTALIRAQQLLRTVNHKLAMALEVANIIPWKWDLATQTILCDVNKPVELMGKANTDDNKLMVPEAEYFAKIHKHDRERVRQAYKDLIEDKVSKIQEEYRVVNHDGDHTHFEWVEIQAAVDTRDTNGKPQALIGSSLVVSARKEMEHELISAKEKAEESSRLKSAFLANMSHEIRTPLNAIVGFSGILASTETEEEKREYVSIIENNNTLLLQLISDILDISKIEAGTLEFVYTDVPLRRLLEEIVQAAQVRNTSDKVVVELVESPDCIIQTERNRVMQVLTNFLTNALKFTSEGSIQVGCRFRDNNKSLYFYVQDTGCGIPADKQKSVFERFIKLNTFSQGTGLGLSICRTIIEKIGGKIGVESEEGKGSTFWFTLPYRPSRSHEDNPAKPDLEQTIVERDKLKILIAEDSADNFKLFETILKKEYQIIHAWDGKEAVELFKQHAPHLVLMDINMPVMNGYEATDEIRKLSDRVPIIAVTAYAYASDEERILKNGFDAYIPKPLNANLMRSKIVELLKKRLILV